MSKQTKAPTGEAAEPIKKRIPARGGARYVEAIQPAGARQEIPDDSTPGLFLIVQPSGSKSWALRYRSPETGKPVKLTLGSYDGSPAHDGAEPEVGQALSLERARKLAGKMKGEVKHLLRDPAADKKRDSTDKKEGRYLVGTLIDKFIESRDVKESTLREYRRIVDKYIRPDWRERDVRKITHRDIEYLLEKIKAPVQRRAVFVVLKMFFGWPVVVRELPGKNPIDSIDGEKAPKARTRSLMQWNPETETVEAREIKWLWSAADDLGYPTGDMLKILLLTGQRLREIARLKWSEIRLDDGAKPAILLAESRTKNGTAHVVPLAPSVVSIIKALPRKTDPIADKPSEWVFTTNGRTASDINGSSKRAIDRHMLKIARKDAGDSSLTIPEWRIHDIRRTVVTGLSSIGVAPHVREAIVNHKSGVHGGVAGVYDRHDYGEEKRQALSAWADRVNAIAGKNVVDINAARSA